MGVTGSRVQKFKSRDSDHVLEIQSVESYSPTTKVIHHSSPVKTTPSDESSKVDNGDNGKELGKIQQEHKESMAATKIPITDAEKRLQQYTKEQSQKCKSDKITSVSGTVRKKGSRKKKSESGAVKIDVSIHSIDSNDTFISPGETTKTVTGVQIQEVSPVSSNDGETGHINNDQNTPLKTDNKISTGGHSRRPTRDMLTMNNAEILQTRRTTNLQLSPVGVKRDKKKIFSDDEDNLIGFAADDIDLSPVGSKRPGQADIINQLGQQGILPPKSETDRTLGELRQIGLIKERPGGTQYTLSIDMPKRQVPRLAPIQTGIQTKRTEIGNPDGYQRKNLGLDKNECCSPRIFTPCTESLGSRPWDDEILPLEVGYYASSDCLKVKMMDLDLL